jgi:hypothetical protein
MAEQLLLTQAPSDPAAWRPVNPIPVTQIVQEFSTSSAAYVAVGNMNVNRPFAPNAKVHYDAGLRPQFRGAYYVANTGGTQANYARVRLYEIDHGDTGLTVIGNGAEVLNSVGATGQYTVGSWSNITWEATPARAHWVIVLEVKTSGGTAFFQMMMYHMRWV